MEGTYKDDEVQLPDHQHLKHVIEVIMICATPAMGDQQQGSVPPSPCPLLREVQSREATSRPPPLQPRQPQCPHRTCLPALLPACCPPLSAFKGLNTLSIVWSPELKTILKVRLHQMLNLHIIRCSCCWGQGSFCRKEEQEDNIKKAEKETGKCRSCFPWHVRSSVVPGGGLHQQW